MTDALKAAVREAIVATFGRSSNVLEAELDSITSVLARRGVVVPEQAPLNLTGLREDVIARASASGESPEPKPTRKVVYITEINELLHAVCDDGTVWSHGAYFGKMEWHPIDPIPQPGDE